MFNYTDTKQISIKAFRLMKSKFKINNSIHLYFVSCKYKRVLSQITIEDKF